MKKLTIIMDTMNQPFCSGVIITKGDKVLVTLNIDGLPERWRNLAWRVGGIGGGQEPNENILECAMREAKEEVSVEVKLDSSRRTFFHDLDRNILEKINVADEIAPFLIQRISNSNPLKPYKPGLPVGPYTYFVLYMASIENWDWIRAGDDVQGLLLVPMAEWDCLGKGATISELKNKGIEIVHLRNKEEGKKLWVPTDESLSMVCKLLLEYGYN
ncbi:NUDIX domain-containing protein [Robertmurraya massiliosenegalensis]|uniref:NUDIX hydrolase n=1 Tax=Robertmurraya TaxID=2837507 RepID=UPI0039A75067